MASLLLSVIYQLEQTQWLRPDELFFHQGRQLRVLFGHAAGTVPFYRQRFAEAGVDPAAAVTWGSIARLPILKRSDLQGAGEAIKPTALPKSQGRRTDTETSGTTGRAVRLLGRQMHAVFAARRARCEALRPRETIGGNMGAA